MFRDQLLHDTSMTHTRLFETRGRCLDTYRITKMAAHLLFKLGQFRENGEFIDVRLKVDKSIFPAHRNVLAANSDYFHAMFTNGMKESNQEVIELKDENISARGFKVVMNSIYSGELLINKKNVFEVLTTASHLQMPTIVRHCCDSWTRSTFKIALTSRRISTLVHLLICTV